MKRVIIFGGTGFIGRNLTEYLRESIDPAPQVLACGSRDFDLQNRVSSDKWFSETAQPFDADHIIHLAAVYKAGGWPMHHPATQFDANMLLNLNALDGWKRYLPGARFTSVVSYCMYPDHDRPHPESELQGTEPESYLFAYAFTKKALLIGQQAYAKEFGLSATSAVLPTVYGPGDSFSEDSHVMGALIGKFARAAQSGTPEVEVWGDGTQEREFLYVKDACHGILTVAQKAESPVLNLGTGESYSIRRIAETIQTVTGFKGEIRYNTDRFVGAKRRLLDVSLVHHELGWKAKHSLQEGIEETAKWYSPAAVS